MWNRCFDICTGDILMHSGDDLRFRTEGWDTLVRDEFSRYADRILFAFGRDGYAAEDFGTHGFIHRNWVDVIGYFVPPYFSSDYNDVWLNDVAELVDRKKKLPIYTEHLHPAAGKHHWDRTHRDRIIRGRKDKVKDLFAELKPKRIQDANKLQGFIDSFSESQ
jgi:hypothetical protein